MTRHIIYGAGAIGGAVGACLFEGGEDVVLIARGEHARAISNSGLAYETPRSKSVLKIPVVMHPSEISFRTGDVVHLATKVQDAHVALATLAAHAPKETPVICLQNGIEGERAALRLFENVYAGHVLCPAEHLEPGLVLNRAATDSGVIDIGRYPTGLDDLVEEVVASYSSADLTSTARDDIMAWKYAKLIGNLANAIQAVFDAQVTFARVDGSSKRIAELLLEEARAVYRAAGITPVSDGDFAALMKSVRLAPIPGRSERQVGSTWQSLARGQGSVETDYLNGEIVLLGRLHGVPTPANALIQRLASDCARKGLPPGAVTEEQFLADLGL
jgi:2-dehydropantoate 2-reductase